MLKRIFAVSLLITTTTMFGVRAQPTAATAPSGSEGVTRVYDISDLLWQKADYPAPAQGDEGATDGDEVHNTQTVSRGEYAQNVTKLLEDTVAPETWRDNGGSLGSIRELAGQLVVTQSVENHQKLDSVLKALRVDRGRMVLVRAYWVLLAPGELPSLAAAGNALPLVDDKLVDAAHLYSVAQTSCFSGQTVHVASGRKRGIVTELTPIVGTNAVGYQAKIEKTSSGIVLQITPHLEPEAPDARIGIDVQSTMTESMPSVASAATQPTDQEGKLDRVNEVAQQLRTTVRLPMAKKVLIGGMTLDPASKDDSGRQLFLVLEANAVK